MSDEREIIWSPLARTDLVEARSYLASHDRVAAAEFAKTILDAVNRLRGFPEIGARLDGFPLLPDLRSFVVSSHRLIYRVTADSILVLRVWNCRQDPARLWEEMEKTE